MKRLIIVEPVEIDGELIEQAAQREDLVAMLLVFDPRSQVADWTTVSGPPMLVRKLEASLRRTQEAQA